MEHTLLDYDEATRNAIAYTTPQSREPFVSCFGYDPETRKWSQGHYFSNFWEAAKDYARMCGRSFHLFADREVCFVRWSEQDVADYLESCRPPVPATRENVERAIDMLGDELGDLSIARGWDAMGELIDERKLSLGLGREADEVFRAIMDGSSFACGGSIVFNEAGDDSLSLDEDDYERPTLQMLSLTPDEVAQALAADQGLAGVPAPEGLRRLDYRLHPDTNDDDYDASLIVDPRAFASRVASERRQGKIWFEVGRHDSLEDFVEAIAAGRTEVVVGEPSAQDKVDRDAAFAAIDQALADARSNRHR